MPKQTFAEQVQKAITGTYEFQAKSFDDETLAFDAIGSDGSVDRHGEKIDPEGWMLKNYEKNPVLLFNHNPWDLPVGKAENVRVEGGKLKFKAVMTTEDENPLGAQLYKLFKGGFLRAFSVGFRPLETDGKETYTKSELLEISVVTIPANPNALALAFRDGTIDKTGRDLLLNGIKKSMEALEEAGDEEDAEVETEEKSVEKAGRVISQANKSKIQSAHDAAVKAAEALAELLTLDDNDEEGSKAADTNIETKDAGETEEQSEEGGDQDLSDTKSDTTDGASDEGQEPELTEEELQQGAAKAIGDAVYSSMRKALGKID